MWRLQGSGAIFVCWVSVKLRLLFTAGPYWQVVSARCAVWIFIDLWNLRPQNACSLSFLRTALKICVKNADFALTRTRMGCLLWFQNMIYFLPLLFQCCLWYHDKLDHVISDLKLMKISHIRLVRKHPNLTLTSQLWGVKKQIFYSLWMYAVQYGVMDHGQHWFCSGNGLSPIWCQGITWTHVNLLSTDYLILWNKIQWKLN